MLHSQRRAFIRDAKYRKRKEPTMPIEPGSYQSEYNTGEAKALIAPLLGCTAEDIDHFIIVARDSTMSKIGVFHTMYCSQPLHSHCKAIDLVGEYLQEVAARIYENTPQHGPGER